MIPQVAFPVPFSMDSSLTLPLPVLSAPPRSLSVDFALTPPTVISAKDPMLSTILSVLHASLSLLVAKIAKTLLPAISVYLVSTRVVVHVFPASTVVFHAQMGVPAQNVSINSFWMVHPFVFSVLLLSMAA